MGKTNTETTYQYYYNGDKLSRMTVNGEDITFGYDANGAPQYVIYGGHRYFYLTNLQGDVTGIVSMDGEIVVAYSYDAWGNPMPATGEMAATLGKDNPLRYRGYVYDEETGLYYLQSRYYNPQIGRFINADRFTSTGQDLLGYNMFAYCSNNPIICSDSEGTYAESALDIIAIGLDIAELAVNPYNLRGWGALAADMACLVLPGITGGGGVVRFVASADNLVDATKYADDVVDAAKVMKSTPDLGRTMHEGYMAAFKGKDFYRNTSIKQVIGEGTSLLRPDAVDIANQVIYELKPYNKQAFRRAIAQTQKYIAALPNGNQYAVVIDMYF